MEKYVHYNIHSEKSHTCNLKNLISTTSWWKKNITTPKTSKINNCSTYWAYPHQTRSSLNFLPLSLVTLWCYQFGWSDLEQLLWLFCHKRRGPNMSQDDLVVWVQRWWVWWFCWRCLDPCGWCEIKKKLGGGGSWFGGGLEQWKWRSRALAHTHLMMEDLLYYEFGQRWCRNPLMEGEMKSLCHHSCCCWFPCLVCLELLPCSCKTLYITPNLPVHPQTNQISAEIIKSKLEKKTPKIKLKQVRF